MIWAGYTPCVIGSLIVGAIIIGLWQYKLDDTAGSLHVITLKCRPKPGWCVFKNSGASSSLYFIVMVKNQYLGSYV